MKAEKALHKERGAAGSVSHTGRFLMPEAAYGKKKARAGRMDTEGGFAAQPDRKGMVRK